MEINTESNDRWSKKHLNLAKAIADYSKDLTQKVGCVIVDPVTNRVISQGYNGFPSKCDENQMVHKEPLRSLLTVHAPMNAIIFSKENIQGCVAYVTHSPCKYCIKHLIAAGIKQVIYEKTSSVTDKGTLESKEAISRLINATKTLIQSVDGALYTAEMDHHPQEEVPRKLKEMFMRKNRFQIASQEIYEHFMLTPRPNCEKADLARLKGLADSGAMSMMALWFDVHKHKAYARRTSEKREEISRTYDGKIIGV